MLSRWSATARSCVRARTMFSDRATGISFSGALIRRKNSGSGPSSGPRAVHMMRSVSVSVVGGKRDRRDSGGAGLLGQRDQGLLEGLLRRLHQAGADLTDAGHPTGHAGVDL